MQQQKVNSSSGSMASEAKQVAPLQATLQITNNLSVNLSLVNAVLDQGQWDPFAEAPAQIKPGDTAVIIATAPLIGQSGIVGDVFYKADPDGSPILFAFRVPFSRAYPNEAAISQLAPSNLQLSVTAVEPFAPQINPVYTVSPQS